jgi:hypothetical protein
MSNEEEVAQLKKRIDVLEILNDKHFKGFITLFSILIEKGVIDDEETIAHWREIQIAYEKADNATNEIDFYKIMEDLRKKSM